MEKSALAHRSGQTHRLPLQHHDHCQAHAPVEYRPALQHVYGPGRVKAADLGQSYGRPTLDVHTWDDTDQGRLTEFLHAEHQFGVHQLVPLYGRGDSGGPRCVYKTSCTTWLDSLPTWDGEKRLPSFFEDYCEVPRTPKAAWCGRSLFLSLVARAYRPRVQVDTMVVLVGGEGIGKTQLCRLLGGPWYTSITSSFDNKDIYSSLRHTWVGELGELDALTKAGREHIKALLTTTVDSYRPPYAHNDAVLPRRTVFIGSTNNPRFNLDQYGGRRFIPMSVGQIDLARIEAVLPQLFAEARVLFQRGENWWAMPPEAAKELHEDLDHATEEEPWAVKH